MAKKRKGGRPTPGGRYTAPTPRQAPSPTVRPETVTESLRRQDTELRARCNRLLGEQPPTNAEWVDADLEAMDGGSATDEELVAYWAAHRRAVELDMMELPDLGEVMSWLAAGKDPVEELDALAGE